VFVYRHLEYYRLDNYHRVDLRATVPTGPARSLSVERSVDLMNTVVQNDAKTRSVGKWVALLCCAIAVGLMIASLVYPSAARAGLKAKTTVTQTAQM
jgi:hypothetical protein